MTISSPGAIPVPRLCGINNDYHLYVEVRILMMMMIMTMMMISRCLVMTVLS